MAKSCLFHSTSLPAPPVHVILTLISPNSKPSNGSPLPSGNRRKMPPDLPHPPQKCGWKRTHTSPNIHFLSGGTPAFGSTAACLGTDLHPLLITWPLPLCSSGLAQVLSSSEVPEGPLPQAFKGLAGASFVLLKPTLRIPPSRV